MLRGIMQDFETGWDSNANMDVPSELDESKRVLQRNFTMGDMASLSMGNCEDG
jgi:hypothetical protein